MHQLAAQRALIQTARELVAEADEHALAHRRAVDPFLCDVEFLVGRQLQKLREQRADLPCSLGVNPQPPAGVEVITGLFGIAPRAHQ